ncbi:hypothetical protein [Vibrio sp. TBV020]|uniref:hypothetical protein n=1 Tax=Vibrio sp. TBV020 TaxID=3137398 RepID=UPI0038CD4A99
MPNVNKWWKKKATKTSEKPNVKHIEVGATSDADTNATHAQSSSPLEASRNIPQSFSQAAAIEPAADSIYVSMLKKGELWRLNHLDHTQGEQTIRNISHSNLVIESLSAEEEEFLSAFESQPFYLTHFTSGDFRTPDGSVTILSRQEMIKQKINFNRENTPRLDIESFATTGFAFTALECGANQKSKSRFGSYKYSVKFSDISRQDLEHAHCQVNDFGNFDQRPSDRLPSYFTQEDKKHFFKGNIVQRSALSLIFHSTDILRGVGLCIIRDIRELTPPTQRRLLSSRTDAEFNEILNCFYRPQLLFPIKLHIKKEQLIFQKLAEPQKHFYV